MELLNETLKLYLEQYCEPEPELLKHIDRETHLKVLMPRMVSGHYQGRVISLLTKLVNPKNILEIGTFTGYATLCFAEGLAEGGKIITIDINEELEDRVRGYFAQSAYADKIDYRIGNAMEIVPTLKETFDIVFIDADKKNNLNYYNLVFNQVKPGGLIIVDNVLWSGKVLAQKEDKDTSNIINFNDEIAKDKSVEKLILPVRDGLFIIRKK
ncbi:O-methyltransferase [Pedobacter puniceum]|uniref:Methyltransferase domain-containing protein n=1 Tax=Pedobacter puniceum TaxID=2666136 RepID=A0A7K0FNS1_9SPHI|nr:class I SAM-dependent methyltransferase [Pedobacter puniceum]MRX47482.1 methyltransferase domain-containing protein [Pedobacter puniceum]